MFKIWGTSTAPRGPTAPAEVYLRRARDSNDGKSLGDECIKPFSNGFAGECCDLRVFCIIVKYTFDIKVE